MEEITGNLEFVNSNRLSKQLIFENNIFQKDSKVRSGKILKYMINNKKKQVNVFGQNNKQKIINFQGRVYWHCTQNNKFGCTSRCITSGLESTDTIITLPTEHNHPPQMLDYAIKIAGKKTISQKR